MTYEEKNKFLETMRKRREIGEQAEQHNREKAKKIIDFVYPTEDRGQWEQALYDWRTTRGMLCLTLNRLPAFINQVIGDQLQNRPQIKVRPAGLMSDKNGATIREGIIRQSEQSSRAKFIVDQAYKTMCASGYLTHWQINTQFVNEDSFDQEIIWQAIEDQFSVIRDPYARENDRRDSNWLFILDTISEDEYTRRYPGKAIPKSADAGLTNYNAWFGDKTVTLAIYWTRKSRKRTLCALASNGKTFWKDDQPDEIKQAVAEGKLDPSKWIERESDDWTTEVSVCSGTDILEDPKAKPWKWIPVVSMIPPYIIKDDGKRWYRAIAEDSIDPQRFYNYWKSLNAQAVKPKPTRITWKMIKNHLKWWDQTDKSAMEYIPYDVDPEAGNGGAPYDPPPPQVSTAIVQEEQSSIEDIKATMGMWNPSLGASEQSLSGKAIGKLQMAGDKGNLEYVNSLVQALNFTGDIILNMNPVVNDTPREITTLGYDNTPSMVKINQATAAGIDNNMTAGNYRSVVDVGPNFTTQRQEALDGIVAITQGNPQLAAVLGPFFAKYADWPDADKIFAILKAMQPPDIQALYDDQPEGGEDNGQIDAMRQQFEAQTQELMAQLEQAGMTVQQLQQAVEESKKILADKERQLAAMKSDFELAKRENALEFKESQLNGGDAKIAAMSAEISSMKSMIESMDRGLEKHISAQPAGGK